MSTTVQQDSTNGKSLIPPVYGPAASWLHFHEWQKLRRASKNRSSWVSYWRAPDYAEQIARTEPARTDYIGFESKLDASSLKGPVKFTLLLMRDHADNDLRLTVSKARLAALTGVDVRTIQRHFKAASEAGFLTRHDFPQEAKRTSEFWLWAGDSPTRDDRWDEYEAGEMVDSPEPFEGW